MRFSVIFIFCLLSIQNINSTVMLNCALGLVEEKQCKVDGGWSLWTTWSSCEGQCSSVGRKIRTRKCSNPQPSDNGVDCVGNQFEVKGCGVPGCSYEQYEKNLAQDSNRLQQLKALKQASGSQNALLTKCLLSHCSFETISQTLGNSGSTFWSALQCVRKNTGCPVAGGWGEWSDWSRCSALCGQGQQFRCHVCCDPPPSSTHTSCPGESCEFQPCTGTQCGQSQKQEGVWSNWSQWSICSAPCRLGLTRRSRTCQKRDQKKAKKSLQPQANKEELRSFDYMDYYDSYFDDSYRQNEDSAIYKEKGFVETDQLSKLKKRAGDKCDTKIEYYSTEDDEEYSITFPKSLIRVNTMQINPLTTINLQNTLKTSQLQTINNLLNGQNLPGKTQLQTTNNLQNIPETIQLQTTNKMPNIPETSQLQTTKNFQNFPKTTQLQLKHLDSPTSVEHLLPISIQPTTEYSYSRTVKVKSTKQSLECSTHLIEHPQKVCSESMSVTSKKPSKPSKDLGKPHMKKKGKSAKHNFECKSTTLISVSTSLETDKPVKTCNSENNSAEEKYMEPNNIQETTVFEERECTDELKNDKEEISMFGNIEVNETHYAKGDKKPHESNTDNGIESTINERKTDESKNTIWTEHTSKTTFITIKPEDDILSLGKKLVITIEPKESLSQTLRYPITERTESLLSTSSSSTPHNEIKNDQSNSNRPSINSSPTTSFENSANSSSVGKKTTDEDLDFDNSTDISNQHSCDIKKIMQLPGYNNSFATDDCKGPFEEVKSCNTIPCGKEGGWSSWSAWSPCSKECDLGKQVSTRSCTQPEPVKKELSCKGETTRKRSCYEQICPVKIATSRAMMMSGESYIKYETLHQHSSVILLYIRFQHFNCSGSLIIRESFSRCGNDHKCDLVHISLYNCYILLAVRKQKCYTYLLSSIQLSIGEWHELLITIVGAAVMMRLDDSFITQSANLSCRPSAPNFDSEMKVGGNFIGEIDQIRINFKNYHLQKKPTKRDILSESEEHVEPEEISQVQFSLNKEETTTLSLASFLHAPCFANESSWRIEVALKPEFSEGLLLFFQGYSQGEFVMVTLEHTRVRLQVKMLSESGECEQPTDIAPHTWIHVAISKPPVGPVGLAVNGGEHCVVSLLSTVKNTEEPSISCNAGIFLGKVPSSVKRVLVNSTEESDSLNSPLGLLGSLTIDNHILDLSRLPHKTASDVSLNHSVKHYKFSSNMASLTVHYEEMFILEGEPFSLICVYDLSSEQTRNSSRNLDLSEYSASWIKLDLPVETAFETSGSNVTYLITDSGKSTSLNVTHYTDFKSIEGFYSCWLQYPLPLQPGLNIITYSVVVITGHQEVSWWTKIVTVSHLIVILILLLLCFTWIVIEAVLNVKTKLGFYHCKKLGYNETMERVRSVMFSKQGTKSLGNSEAANESYQRYLAQMDANMLATEYDRAKDLNELEPFSSDASEDNASVDDVKIRIPDRKNVKGKGMRQPTKVTVGYVTEEQHLNPYFTKKEHLTLKEKPSHFRVIKGKVLNPSNMSIDDLQRSEDEDTLNEKETGGGKEMTILRNYSIDNPAELKKKEVGLIQKTSAYKSIENELKFKPEKLQFLEKKYKNKGNK